MKMPKTGPSALARFEAVADAMAERGARRGSMFGMPMLKSNGKVFAGTFGDAMTFKLGPEDLAKALRTKGAVPFEPMPGRPMKEWVLVPIAQANRWLRLAEQARAYVSG